MVAVTVLVLVEVLVMVDVLVLVVGSVEEDVVDDEELLDVVVVVLCVVSVVVDVDVEGDEVVVVVVVVREVDVFGVIGPPVLELEPPKIKKISVVNRTPPIAPYITSAQGFVYQGVSGPSGPSGPPGGGRAVGMSSVGCSEYSLGSGGGS
jgi:hypothetical protein